MSCCMRPQGMHARNHADYRSLYGRAAVAAADGAASVGSGVCDLRRDIDPKLVEIRLQYFDRHDRGGHARGVTPARRMTLIPPCHGTRIVALLARC